MIWAECDLGSVALHTFEDQLGSKFRLNDGPPNGNEVRSLTPIDIPTG